MSADEMTARDFALLMNEWRGALAEVDAAFARKRLAANAIKQACGLAGGYMGDDKLITALGTRIAELMADEVTASGDTEAGR